jgi:hypothetical protein
MPSWIVPNLLSIVKAAFMDHQTSSEPLYQGVSIAATHNGMNADPAGRVHRLLLTLANEAFPIVEQPAKLLSLVGQLGPFRHCFVTYAGEPRYAEYYCDPSSRFFKLPCDLFFMGVYRQGNAWGIKLGISGGPELFVNHDGAANCQRLLDQVSSIRASVNISSTSYAGILPGIMYRLRLRREIPERDSVAAAVVVAAARLSKTFNLSNAPLFLVGGNGFIGRAIAAKLDNAKLIIIDSKDGAELHIIAQHREPALVINTASPSAIENIAQFLMPSSIVLNEAYPGPTDATVSSIRHAGSQIFHVSGVAGEAWPPFPFHYASGIPCCAAIPTAPIDPVVIEL